MLIFNLKAQLPIFSKSSLRSLAEVLISLTRENREVSSANSLHSLLRPSDKSLIYILLRKAKVQGLILEEHQH